MLNKNFRDMLNALNDSGAEYLVAWCACPATLPNTARATGDFDIWIRPTRENADRVWRRLIVSVPQMKLTIEDLHTPNNVYQIGVEPDESISYLDHRG